MLNRKIINENIERVEWTLKDPNWRPSRLYFEKLFAAYKELANSTDRGM